MESTDYPTLAQVASRGSRSGQRAYKRMATFELWFVVLGAAGASALAIGHVDERILATVAAIAFAGALAIRLAGRLRADDRMWFDGRAVAETVKSQSWRYMMRVPPYDDDATADRVLVHELTATMAARPAVAELPPVQVGGSQISSRMREVRALGLAERRAIYLDERIRDQVAWYGTSAQRHRRVANRWSLAATVLEASALAIALLTIAFPSQIASFGLLGVLASGAAAATAWNQLSRNGELSRSYGLAHHELAAIANLAEVATTEADLEVSVRDAELAISREHTMWVAKRSELPPLLLAEPEPRSGPMR